VPSRREAAAHRSRALAAVWVLAIAQEVDVHWARLIRVRVKARAGVGARARARVRSRARARAAGGRSLRSTRADMGGERGTANELVAIRGGR
jgi:hypothetical protein